MKKKALFFLNYKKIYEFLQNLDDFYVLIDDTDKERIFLTKH